MKYEYYKMLVGEYFNLGRDKERLLAEVGFTPEVDLTAEGLVKAIDIIAAVADADIPKLVEISGLNLIGFARKMQIPYRSLQDWCAAHRTPPIYVPILIGYVLVSELPSDEQ